MDTATMMELQKEREAGWVQAGVERFREHCARQDAAGNPNGRALMRSVMGRVEDRFERHAVEARGGSHPARDRVLAIIDILGARHLAAICTTSAINGTLSPKRDKEVVKGQVIKQAEALAEAVEHDIRLRAWTPEADKALVQRMRKDMESNPRGLRRRLAQLREVATEAWSIEDGTTLGMDLLFLVADAAPDVFLTPVVRYGGKTLRVLKLTDEAMTQMEMVEEMASVNAPKWSMMLVPPRRWEYGAPA